MSESTRQHSPSLAWVPNTITASRFGFGLALLGGAIWLTFLSNGPSTSSALFGLVMGGCYFLGALSDLVDGSIARMLKAESDFGARLDPIADKAFALCALLLIVAVTNFAPVVVAAACLVVLRDWWIDQLRAKRPNVGGLKVSFLAKLKTAILFLAMGLLLTGLEPWPQYLDALSGGVWNYAVGGFLSGVVLLWVATALALYTGWRYVEAARASVTEVAS